MWPALSLYFDLHPWDVERLTVPELTTYARRAVELQRAANQPRR